MSFSARFKRVAALLPILWLLHLSSHPAGAEVLLFKTQSEYRAKIAELNLGQIREGFESSDWDSVRSPTINDRNSAPSVTSQGLTWETAARDLWSSPSSRQYGITTNHNWARSGEWGIYEEHSGDAMPTTIRVTSEELIYGVGGWFNTNPDFDDFGFLFEDKTDPSPPGYFLPGFGAMYPGDNAGSGHNFAGIIDTDGFYKVILTGTLQINEENQLEGGIIYGADDFTFATSSAVPEASPLPLLLIVALLGLVWRTRRRSRATQMS